MLLFIIFNIIILIIGLAYIGLGIYLLLYGRIGSITVPELGRYLFIGLGSVACLIAIGFMIYALVRWNRPFRPILAAEVNIGDSEFFLNHRFNIYNPTLEMFASMVYSTFYTRDGLNVIYKGNNFRGEIKDGIFNNYYTKFFDKEITSDERDLIGIQGERDNAFNDERIIIIWNLYKRYLETRYNHTQTLKDLKNYQDLSVRIINKYNSNVVSLYKSLNLPQVLEAYLAIFKLLRRDLIPDKYGFDILKALKPMVYLLLSEDRELARDSLMEYNMKMDKELKRENHYPVNLIHRNGIRFNGVMYTEVTLNNYFLELNIPRS